MVEAGRSHLDGERVDVFSVTAKVLQSAGTTCMYFKTEKSRVACISHVDAVK
jgi:hypothetical protein